MDMPYVDPYSYAKPGIARVIHTHLELFVDFDETVLRGTAILFIKTKARCEEIILDIYQLNEDKMDISEYSSNDKLKYDVKQTPRNIGVNEFVVIQIPQKYRGRFTEFKYKYCNEPYQIDYNYAILITYETRKDSPVLYWLRSDQTSDGTHPLLITNNKFTYARGIFPCQDSPSVRFTFTAEISVPNNFNTVIICGRTCRLIINDGDRHIYMCFEMFPMPSYAMIIMVGSLETIHLDLQHNVSLWAEKKYIEQSKSCFANFHHILTIAKELCGPIYINDKDDVREYNICVLPPNIPEIDLSCLSMIFVSSTLLNEDSFLICSTIAQKVAQNWAGGLVTCTNFQHLWLNKSFSTFISRRIVYFMYQQNIIPDKMSFLERKTVNDLIIKKLSIFYKWIYGPNLRHMSIEDLCTLYPELHCLMTKSQGYLLATQEFLSHLYASNMVLPVAKLWWLRRMFPLDEQTCENRLLLLLLYIKNKWLEMIQPALEFVREYCSPMFACPIFRELYKLEETRHLAISGFTAIVEKKCKMLPQTIQEVAYILKINLKDIYILTSEESTLHVKTRQ
ncbi:PREDICTED: leukotriene A-4 hydrolase-like [Acromyrmex echinatior]|uniref:leukotriene A-4 hydrolase-like n=1 Tax=Acromyrmex echinatior TaxID=103372 RepID=UPI000580E65A|nr:PREDICTED: leukotriene A-4 hydrolase-like [Acromyrmex echinatior]